MDISQLNYADSADIPHSFNVILPDGITETDIIFMVRGEQSPEVKNYQRRVFAEQKRAAEMRKRKNQDPDPALEEQEETLLNLTVNRLVGWKGLTEQGKEIPFSPEKAKELLQKAPWMRDQIIEASNQILNFRPK